MTSAVTFVAERMMMPWYSGIRLSISSASHSVPTSTWKPCSSRNVMPSGASFSLTRTFFLSVIPSPRSQLHGALHEHLFGGGRGGAELDVVAQLRQHHLDRAQAHDDVAVAEVAAVAEAEDLALERPLATGQPDAPLVACQLAARAAVKVPAGIDGGKMGKLARDK